MCTLHTGTGLCNECGWYCCFKTSHVLWSQMTLPHPILPCYTFTDSILMPSPPVRVRQKVGRGRRKRRKNDPRQRRERVKAAPPNLLLPRRKKGFVCVWVCACVHACMCVYYICVHVFVCMCVAPSHRKLRRRIPTLPRSPSRLTWCGCRRQGLPSRRSIRASRSLTLRRRQERCGRKWRTKV